MKIRLVLALPVLLAAVACAPKKEVRPEQPVAPPKEEMKLPAVEIREEPSKEARPRKEEPAKPEKKAEEQYVMLNFENADIETVVATVGEMLKINYILAPGVSGKITIQSHNKIPISELFSTFQTVLEFNGFTAVKYGSFYRIVPIDTAKQQPVPIESGKKQVQPKDDSFVTQEIVLEYVKANDAANLVRNLMPRGSDIIVYEPANMLIVTASPAGIAKFLKILEAVDIPTTARDAVKTFVYYVENGEAKKLADLLRHFYGLKKKEGPEPAVKTAAPQAAPAAPKPAAPAAPARPLAPTAATIQEGLTGDVEGEIIIEAYEEINALIIRSTPRSYLTLLETIKKLDVQPKQVMIEVMIAEITLDDSMKFGVEWMLKGSGTVGGKAVTFLSGSTDRPDSLAAKDTEFFGNIEAGMNFLPVAGGGIFANVMDPDRFNAFVSATANKDKINVLASPHILALDNKEAKIEIGDEVPVATSISQPTQTTMNTTSQVQFKSAGIILTVTPHINEKKQVTLKIVQEASELGSTVKIGGQDYQGFKTRKASTMAVVQDGHTLVLGGIISDRMQKTRTGIPFLSSIPLLGYLFGTTTDTVARKELILLVTPRVVGNTEEADVMSDELKNRVKGIKEKIEKKLLEEKKNAVEETKSQG